MKANKDKGTSVGFSNSGLGFIDKDGNETVCKEHEWVEIADSVKQYILSTGNEINENTIGYAILFSKKWDNLTGKEASYLLY